MCDITNSKSSIGTCSSNIWYKNGKYREKQAKGEKKQQKIYIRTSIDEISIQQKKETRMISKRKIEEVINSK